MIVMAICMLIVGVILGGYAFFWLLTNSYKKDPEAVLQYLDNKLERALNDTDMDFVELEISQHGTQIMAWFKETGVFVAQGESIDEVIILAHDRFPKINFMGELPEDIEFHDE